MAAEIARRGSGPVVLLEGRQAVLDLVRRRVQGARQQQGYLDDLRISPEAVKKRRLPFVRQAELAPVEDALRAAQHSYC